MRSRSAAALLGGLALALAGCSSSGIPAATTSSISASVTQTAPSVWSAPNTVSTGAPGSPSNTDANEASGSSTLPGLTEDCSAAIRAQLAVNNLFTEALHGPTGGTTPTAAGATPATSAAPSGITAERVAGVFDGLAPTIPRKLAAALTALRHAADSVVGKPVTDIPAVLNGTDVTEAMDAFRHYVAACEPKPSD
jgi:hypothetical protein